MKRFYELKIVLTVDDASRGEIIERARSLYGHPGCSLIDADGTDHPLTPEEAIQTTDDALMELLHTHPAFGGSGIEIQEVTCTAEECAAVDQTQPLEFGELDLDDLTPDEPEEESLDESEADVYLCRWPNGDFSIVGASTKREAIFALDEWAGAHPSQVHALSSFKADFRLTDEGEIELTEFGEETWDLIWEACYPKLRDVIHDDAVTDMAGGFRPDGRERVLKAVTHERERLWNNQPVDTPKTELGKRIATSLGTSAVVADYHAEKLAQRILESEAGEDGKPN
ncbi:MAG: hypothetical protein K2X35_03585 [Bryobacteraceae bacterium]|nr:hypothetical protein [Bryobacteraceae bacterium]